MKTVLSYGMGVDSTAILLRWLEDPYMRDFDLDDLIVVTAQVGDEFPETARLVSDHILPLLRENGIRYVQLARAGATTMDGVSVLSDTDAPSRVHIDGKYRLSDELISAATVPQFAKGKRLCTQKFKGWVLDRWLEEELGDEPFVHVIGFNAEETSRVERDKSYVTETGKVTLRRSPSYPLVEWGMGREACERFIARIVGEEWMKSCCVFCPFAKKHVIPKLAILPEVAAKALFIEHLSLAFNPRMPLYPSGKSLRVLLEEAGNEAALELFEDGLDNADYALYRVQRVMRAKGIGSRSVKRIAEGDREEMTKALERFGRVTGEGGILRVFLRRREEGRFPTAEEMIVAAPAVVADKVGRGFDPQFLERMAE